jgi:hypothetical protein
MGCRDEPITCRKKIAARFGLAPHKDRSWQFGGACPCCGHGGFSITAGDQGRFPPRHVWHCNCHRCRCDPADVRAAMLRAGVPGDCLGTFARNRPAAREHDGEAAGLRAAMTLVLADDKIRALADLKLRMAEVLWGDAPADWDGFVAFAERAGVSRSKRYDAAARWGRQRQ